MPPLAPPGARYPWRKRLAVVVALLLSMLVVQHAVFLRRLATNSGPTLLAGDVPGIAIVVLVGIGATSLLVLKRGVNRTDPVVATVAGAVGWLVVLVVNLRAETLYAADGNTPVFPYVRWVFGRKSVGGVSIDFYPGLLVLKPAGGGLILLDPVVFGTAVCAIATWLWLSQLPDEVLDMLDDARTRSGAQ